VYEPYRVCYLEKEGYKLPFRISVMKSVQGPIGLY
jgi:hypothetical protein